MNPCSDPGCVAFRFDEAAAVAEGWADVDGKLFCPCHGPIATRKARKAVEQARLEAYLRSKREFHDEKAAKKSLTTAEYAAWHEYQQDLVNFQREQRKLPEGKRKELPRELKSVRPGEWLQTYRQVGKIDIEASIEGLKAEKARQAALRKRALRQR